MNLSLKVKMGLGFVLVVFVFSFFVIFGNFISVQSVPEVTGPPPENSSSDSNSLQKIAQPTRYYNDINSLNTNVVRTELAQPNLTREIADDLSQMIVQRNPNGPFDLSEKKTIRAPALEASVASAFSKTKENIDASYYQPEVKKEELKIVSNSPEAAAYYITSLLDILKANFKNLKRDWNKDSQGIENIDVVLQTYDQAIRQLYELSVPENLAPNHQKEISLVIGQKRVWEDLSKYKEDPFRSLIASEFHQVNNEEFAKLKDEIIDFIKKNNIELKSQ